MLLTTACKAYDVERRVPRDHVRLGDEYVGAVPLLQMTSNVLLEGARRVDVWTLRHGARPLAGSFRLTFRGATTVAIDVDDSAGVVETKLTDLDTSEAGGVNVSKVLDVDPFANGIERMGGDVVGAASAATCRRSVLLTDNDLTGSNVSLNIYPTAPSRRATGARPPRPRRSWATSSAGASRRRGHASTPIEFNAARRR